MESSEWLNGENSKPKLVSMDPEKNELGIVYTQNVDRVSFKEEHLHRKTELITRKISESHN